MQTKNVKFNLPGVMTRKIALLLSLLIAGCGESITAEDSSNCWRYGVQQNNNTGPMSQTPVMDIPVIKLGYDELLKACRSYIERDGEVLNACYNPTTDTIYQYNSVIGDYYINHERCHVLLGRRHNGCNGSYAQFEDSELSCK